MRCWYFLWVQLFLDACDFLAPFFLKLNYDYGSWMKVFGTGGKCQTYDCIISRFMKAQFFLF